MDSWFLSEVTPHFAPLLMKAYVWYQFSGLKTVVKTSKSIESELAEVKEKLAANPPSVDEAMNYFRSVAKSYRSLIPEATTTIDSMLDTLDELKKTNSQEVEKIIKETYDELKETVMKGAFDLKTGEQVAEILKRRAPEVQDLANRVGTDLIKPVIDKNPELRDAIGDSYEDLKRLVGLYGAEAEAKYDDLVKKLKEIFDRGLPKSSIKQARDLVQQTTREIRETGEKKAKDGWDKTSKQAKQYLDKMPDVKKTLEENKESLIASGEKNIQEIYDQIELVVNNGLKKQNIADLEAMIEEKAKNGFQSGRVSWDESWRKLEEYMKKLSPSNEVLVL